MNFIAVAKETIVITQAREYLCGEQKITFPEGDFSAVEVITPETGEKLLQAPPAGEKLPEPCRITVVNADSFSAARTLERALVLNFANAHHAGGGFLLGASAQEEALCRCSTLYSSITAEPAKEMYRYNNTHLSAVESDYMLLSPRVLVFRDPACNLITGPFETAVITAPAPNRRGAAMLASKETLRATFLRRIRIILRLAAARGYRSLVLGAWGCGAFGNDPQMVAGCFREALETDGLREHFAAVCFAVYGNPDGRNFTAFRDAFAAGSAPSDARD